VTELHPLISKRWSPRAFDPTVELTDSQLHALLEAARWAPSCANLQPARFIVGRRGDSTFKRIFDTLRPGNQSWAGNASALLIGAIVTVDDKGRSMPAAEYGLGLAAENLVLQAVAEGLVAHQMAGFDPEAVRVAFGVPAEAQPLVAIAVGGHGSLDVLSEELQAREVAPRVRKPLSETVFTDSWGTSAFQP
jgi:nitroreductase